MHRAELGDPDTRRYPRALAERIAAEHRTGTRTLAVLNTVQRATATFDELVRIAPDAELVLLHSRYRPGDRRKQTRHALAELGPAGTVVVATQVLEAGVDVTSNTLVTEVAPWSSIVQRAGRCNRDGAAPDATLLWSHRRRARPRTCPTTALSWTTVRPSSPGWRAATSPAVTLSLIHI